MSFAFLKRAFSLKKSADEHHIDDFLKWYHTEGFINPGLISKLFRKCALRLIVIKKPNNTVIYDSSSGKDHRRMPCFGIGSKSSTLADIAFGSFSLTPQSDLKSSLKLHDLNSSHHLLLTCVYYPPTKRVRSSNSACYLRKQSEVTSSDFWSSNSLRASVDVAVAICVLVNIDWTHALIKPINNSPTCDFKSTLPEELSQRFYMLFFEHFLQISVSFQSLSDVIGRILTGASKLSQSSNDGINDTINRAFADFQRTIRDLCILRLPRPIWSSLTLAYASQFDSPTGLKRLNGCEPACYQSYPLNITPFPSQYEQISNSFVRGCLCSLISKNMSKDRSTFLAQLVTGLLMQHRGWISTVMSNSHVFTTDMCSYEPSSDGFTYETANESRMDNSLLVQQLIQSGCDMNRHTCSQSSILNACGTALATTVIYDSVGGNGLQHQQHRDRLLALLYLSSYFLRSPNFLLQSVEDVPDMGLADAFELGRQRHHSLQRPRGFSGRRKSSSQLSASLMLGQRGSGVADTYDSGIASQEDLSAAMLHTLQQYSASAGSSPSHPPVGPSAICLPGRLTNEQCRLAEVAAQALVSREFAAAAAAATASAGNIKAPQTQQNQQYSNPSSTSTLHSEPQTSKHREHTRTVGVTGRNRKVIASGGGNGEVTGNSVYPPLTPNLSTGVPCFSASISSPSNDARDLTEVPLLIERTYIDRWDSCWCLGEGIGHAVLGKHYLSNRKASSDPAKPEISPAVTVRYGSSVERYNSFENDDSVELGTVCHADMESSDDGTQSSLGGTNNVCSELILHSPIGASVLEHYTSGLALQATTESPSAFRPRLVDDLTSWLRFAPALHRRGIRPPPSLRPNSRTRAPVHSGPQNPRNSYRCTALLVNADAGSVELLTLRSASGRGGPGGQRRSRSGKRCSNSISSSSPSTGPASLNFFPLPYISTSQSYEPTDQRVAATANYDSSTDDEYSETPTNDLRPLVAAPLVMKLLETVKTMYDRSGGCSSLALQHLESGLQNICGLGCMLADLLIPSITSVEEGPDAVEILKHSPETIANIIGCHLTDLPLLLSISGSVSCRVASIIERNELDQMW